jgi:hypothetical protein
MTKKQKACEGKVHDLVVLQPTNIVCKRTDEYDVKQSFFSCFSGRKNIQTLLQKYNAR